MPGVFCGLILLLKDIAAGVPPDTSGWPWKKTWKKPPKYFFNWKEPHILALLTNKNKRYVIFKENHPHRTP